MKIVRCLPQSIKMFAKFILSRLGSRAEWRLYLWDISQLERIVEYGWTQNMKHREGKVLHVGCWGTLFPIQLASLGYKVVGVDLRDYPYSHPNFEFVRGDLLDPSVQKTS